MTLIALGSWFAMWWLAVRSVFGRWFFPFEWIPVAILGFGVPLLAAGATSTRGTNDYGKRLLLGWGGVAASIDGVWAVRRAIRWYTRRKAEWVAGR